MSSIQIPLTEKITVNVPLFSRTPWTMRDESGYFILLPSGGNKNIAEVYDPKKRFLCETTMQEVQKINDMGFWGSPESIITRSYDFEAPTGTIPNLCKKDEGRGK